MATVVHIRVTLGHLRVFISHHRVILRMVQVTIGHYRITIGYPFSFLYFSFFQQTKGKHNWASPESKTNLLFLYTSPVFTFTLSLHCSKLGQIEIRAYPQLRDTDKQEDIIPPSPVTTFTLPHELPTVIKAQDSTVWQQWSYMYIRGPCAREIKPMYVSTEFANYVTDFVFSHGICKFC